MILIKLNLFIILLLLTSCNRYEKSRILQSQRSEINSCAQKLSHSILEFTNQYADIENSEDLNIDTLLDIIKENNKLTGYIKVYSKEGIELVNISKINLKSVKIYYYGRYGKASSHYEIWPGFKVIDD